MPRWGRSWRACSSRRRLRAARRPGRRGRLARQDACGGGLALLVGGRRTMRAFPHSPFNPCVRFSRSASFDWLFHGLGCAAGEIDRGRDRCEHASDRCASISATQPAEERVERSFRRHQAFGITERADELVAVALAVAQQREHTELEHAMEQRPAVCVRGRVSDAATSAFGGEGEGRWWQRTSARGGV